MSPALGAILLAVTLYKASAHILDLATPFIHSFIYVRSSDASNRRRNYYKNKQRTYSMLVAELKGMIQIAQVEQVIPKYLLEQQ
jgi:hypothetical protein